jgi:hypothetical protein
MTGMRDSVLQLAKICFLDHMEITMNAIEQPTINLVEVRHQGGSPLLFQYLSPKDYLTGEAVEIGGNTRRFHIPAEHIVEWASDKPGIEVAVANIGLPSVDLTAFFAAPQKDGQKLGLAAVCSPYDLVSEARKAGSVGTIFTESDVADALEWEGGEEYARLPEDMKAAFVDANWQEFAEGIEDIISERGNFHISTNINTKLDGLLEEFARQSAPSI